MMQKIKLKIRCVGALFLAGMLAGVLSVVPEVDSAEYLNEAATNAHQVRIGASFQFIMALAYMGIGIFLYPILKSFDRSLAIGFLSFRIIAATLVIVGTIALLSILALSQEYARYLPQSPVYLEALGNVLKATRDYINHVFMILVLCAGNIILYILFIRTRLIPNWLAVWGVIGNLLSVVASVLILFQIMDIISTPYILLNVPTALQELILAIWLLTKGFDGKVLLAKEA
ncbi:DUF4386 domain-containing protein [Catalinimonas sp. 4WD22]|uniref:DUF4386 domain-containing protein n=1 Tax=Catalinimonas locisalis TaxID=3133978 RepID=UPI0031015C4E